MNTSYHLSILAAAALAVFTLSACDDDNDYVGASPVADTCDGLYFDGDKKSVEVEPDSAATTGLTVCRMDSADAATYKLVVVKNSNDAFTVPETVAFAAGEKSKTITVDYSKAPEGIECELQLSFEDAQLNPYKTDYLYTLKATRLKWDDVGTGYWVDGNVKSHYSSVEAYPLIVQIQKVTLSSGTMRFRFTSPFNHTVTYTDENGATDGYKYNDPGDCDGEDHKFVITVNGTEASLAPVILGFKWAYGNFTIGQIYPDIKQDKTTFPLGIYSKADNTITFPKSSLYRSMETYKNGNKYPAKYPSYLYLTKQAYLDAKKKESESQN